MGADDRGERSDGGDDRGERSDGGDAARRGAGRVEDEAPVEGGQVAEGQHVMVVDSDGRPVGTVRVPGGDTGADRGAGTGASGVDGTDDGEPSDPSEMVEQPAKVMRIGTMIKQLLEEVRATELDEASRVRLREVHATSLAELSAALSPELREELARLAKPFEEGAFAGGSTPTDGELRIAQAQLVGWLEGLFHGIQTTLVAQQMAAKMQLEQMRRGLPAGTGSGTAGGGTTGQYL